MSPKIVMWIVVLGGGLLAALLPTAAAVSLGWFARSLHSNPWPLLVVLAGTPLMAFWFRVVARIGWMDKGGGPGLASACWNLLFAFSMMTSFIVPAFFVFGLIPSRYGPWGAIFGLVAGVGLASMVFRFLQRFDPYDAAVPVSRSSGAGWKGPALAWIATILVAVVIAAPESLRIMEGVRESGYESGRLTARLIIAFVVGALLASGTKSWGLSFHGRLNIAALAVGLFLFYVLPVGAG